MARRKVAACGGANCVTILSYGWIVAETPINDFEDLLQILGCENVADLDRVLAERTGHPSAHALPPTRPNVERVSISLGSTLGQLDFPFALREFWALVGSTGARFEERRKWDGYRQATISLLNSIGLEWWSCGPDGRCQDDEDTKVPEWVVTAHNPAGMAVTVQENEAANQRLASELHARGIDFVRAIGGARSDGSWTNQEASFAFDSDREVALELAAMFGQDALFRIRSSSVEVIDATTGKIASVRYDPVEPEDDDEADDGCEACAGLEELMVENAEAGQGPHESMGYLFGYSDTCEMCGRSVDTVPAFEAHESRLRDLKNESLQAALNSTTAPQELVDLASTDDQADRRAPPRDPG